MTVAEWLAAAKADAEKRALPELIPALEGLAKATEQLRRADWNESPSTRSSASPGDADDLAQGRPSLAQDRASLARDKSR